jgi:hypothetical protein
MEMLHGKYINLSLGSVFFMISVLWDQKYMLEMYLIGG